jgi:hypothetical protein
MVRKFLILYFSNNVKIPKVKNTAKPAIAGKKSRPWGSKL